jgi:hypothetical protein
MPLQKITRNILLDDTKNLDSFSRTRTADVSQKSFIDFKYGITNNPRIKLNVSSTGFRPTITFDSINRSAKFNKTNSPLGASQIIIRSETPCNLKLGSTFKGYISFTLISVNLLTSSESISIGFGGGNGGALLESGGFIFRVGKSATSGLTTYAFSTISTFFTGGSEEVISRSSWTDPLDGTGPSGITINFGIVQTFFVKTKTGRSNKITYGFVIDGEEIEAYSETFQGIGGFSTFNYTSSFYPYADIVQNSTTSPGTIYEIYSITTSIEDDGEKTPELQYDFSTSLSTGSLAAGAYRRVFAITLPGTTPYLTFIKVILKSLKIVNTGTVPLHWELRTRESIPSTSFTSINSNSFLQINTVVSTTTTSSDKIVALAGFVNPDEISVTKIPESIANSYPIGEIASTAPTSERGISLWITPVSSTTAVSARVTLNYKEIQP